MNQLTNVFITTVQLSFPVLITATYLVSTIGWSEELTCQRWEYGHSTCQKQEKHFYGLWKNTTPTFSLQSASIEKMERHGSYGKRTRYYLRLNAANHQKISFGDYDIDRVQVQADVEQLRDVMSGYRRSPLHLIQYDLFIDMLYAILGIVLAPILAIFLGLWIKLY